MLFFFKDLYFLRLISFNNSKNKSLKKNSILLYNKNIATEMIIFFLVSEIKQTISKAWLLEAFYGAYLCLKTKELSKVTVCLNEASKLLENYSSVLLLRANTLFYKKHILLALKDLNCLSEIKHECEGNEKDLRQRINAFVNKREEYKN
jgi:hypothetical protein